MFKLVLEKAEEPEINCEHLLDHRKMIVASGPNKVSLVKALVFPGVIYGCESWTIRNAERGRIDAFVLWC